VVTERRFLGLGAVFAFLGVALGAFGAHGLRGSLSAGDLATFETAVRYQLVHALGLLAVAWASTRWPTGTVRAAGWLMAAGIVLFSGSLFGLALAGPTWMAAVTPLGGLCFLAAGGAPGVAARG